MARASTLFPAFCVFLRVTHVARFLALAQFTGAEFHEGNPFRSTQVVLVRSLPSIPRVLGLWAGSSSSTTLRYPILTRAVSCLMAMRRFGSPGSRWVDILVPRVVWLLRCAASSAASCRGNSCRVSGAGMIVRWFTTLFLAPMGSLEGPFIEMHCVLAWLGLLARGFLVASDGFIYPGPMSASLGLSVDEVLCLYTQDPVAHDLIRRCVLHSLCLLFQFCPVPDLAVSPLLFPWSFQCVFNVSRFLVWLRAKRASTCECFPPLSGGLVFSSPSTLVWPTTHTHFCREGTRRAI